MDVKRSRHGQAAIEWRQEGVYEGKLQRLHGGGELICKCSDVISMTIIWML